jgi:WhiB family redox-sensing transcriptional regulator
VNPGPPEPPESACSGRRRQPRPPRGSVSLRPATWLQQAACANADPDLFFPDDSRSAVREAKEREAKEWCAGCLVQPECLDYSLATGQEFGVWGGLTEKERHNLLRARHGQGRQARERTTGPAR